VGVDIGPQILRRARERVGPQPLRGRSPSGCPSGMARSTSRIVDPCSTMWRTPRRWSARWPARSAARTKGSDSTIIGGPCSRRNL